MHRGLKHMPCEKGDGTLHTQPAENVVLERAPQKLFNTHEVIKMTAPGCTAITKAVNNNITMPKP